MTEAIFNNIHYLMKNHFIEKEGGDDECSLGHSLHCSVEFLDEVCITCFQVNYTTSRDWFVWICCSQIYLHFIIRNLVSKTKSSIDFESHAFGTILGQLENSFFCLLTSSAIVFITQNFKSKSILPLHPVLM